MKADNEIKKNLGNDIRRLFGGNRWLVCRQLGFWLGRELRGCGDDRWFEECIRNQGRLCRRHRIERLAMLSHLRFDRYQNCFRFRLPKDRFLKCCHSLLISQFLRHGWDDLLPFGRWESVVSNLVKWRRLHDILNLLSCLHFWASCEK